MIFAGETNFASSQSTAFLEKKRRKRLLYKVFASKSPSGTSKKCTVLALKERPKAVYYRAVFRAEIEKCCRFCQKNLYYRTEILTKSRNSEKTGVRNRVSDFSKKGRKSEILTKVRISDTIVSISIPGIVTYFRKHFYS